MRAPIENEEGRLLHCHGWGFPAPMFIWGDEPTSESILGEKRLRVPEPTRTTANIEVRKERMERTWKTERDRRSLMVELDLRNVGCLANKP